MKRVEIPSRFFFSTPPAPCPYLENRLERKVVTLLAGEDPDGLHNTLSHAGFRRSQDLAYRPACDGCSACIPIRVRATDFRLKKSFRRIWKANSDITARILPSRASREHFELFHRYLQSRHSEGGMVDMDYIDYQAMVEESPVRSRLVEFRKDDGSLFAVCLIDLMEDGLSLVYSYFDPEEDKRSPGSFLILWHISEAERQGLPYVYLGYWIDQSPKMAYKKRFYPSEILTRDGWQLISE
ncbi:arginyltransferase [uncultured Sneathiella sp.]|jgi:arginine-tRNA-protein transferase|uniref:arginyltransferase n=1 Tax=uncultured Sneathiella sp. TaxID=879315 RepID=UPI0030D93819|tara:strand:+ start:525 stop:1244 length:720 start_codon:yes stop_codon:yes gene_type:complete